MGQACFNVGLSEYKTSKPSLQELTKPKPQHHQFQQKIESEDLASFLKTPHERIVNKNTKQIQNRPQSHW